MPLAPLSRAIFQVHFQREQLRMWKLGIAIYFEIMLCQSLRQIKGLELNMSITSGKSVEVYGTS